MNIKNIKGSVALKAICLVLVMALLISSLVFLAPTFTASAKTNKDLWRNNSNVVFDGNSITTKNDDNETILYRPSVYMDGFNFKFKMTSNDFSKFVISFSSKATLESNLVGKVDTNIALSKNEDGKIVATINDNESVDTIDLDFYNTDLVLTFDKANNQFKLNDAVIGEPQSNFYLDIADTMSIKLQNITEDKVASIVLQEICGVDLSGSFEDTTAPLIKFEEEKVPDNVCMGNTVKIPFMATDKLDSDLTYDLKVEYSATSDMAKAEALAEEQIIATTTGIKDAFIAKKAGFYKATLTVKDSNGNEAVQEFNTINAVESTMSNLTIASDYIVEEPYQELGEYFKMPIPEVSYEIDTDVFSNQAKVAIQYKAPTSTEWAPSISTIKNTSDENTLLAVKGVEIGEYLIRYVVLDSRGENLVVGDEVYKVQFNDTIAPTIKAEGFVEEAIVNKAYSVTVMSATDKGSSNLTKTTKVFKKGQDGEEDKEMKLTGNLFVPTELGDYYVIYTAKDASGNEGTLLKEFKVVEDTTSAVGRSLSALEIVLICVASIAVVGIVLLFVIKPKKK